MAIPKSFRVHSRILRWPFLLVGCSLMLTLLALAACSSSTLSVSGPAAHATATAQAQTTVTAAAQATRAAQPVLLAMQVTQQGALAAGNAHLLVMLTVTNQADQTIQLTSPGCRTPPLVFEVRAGKQTLWSSWIPPNGCPASMPYDERAVSAGSTYITTINGDLALVTRLGVPKLQAGVPYAIRGKLWIWHQGTLDQYNQSEALSGNDLTISVPFTLR